MDPVPADKAHSHPPAAEAVGAGSAPLSVAEGVVWCTNCGGHHGLWPDGTLYTPICMDELSFDEQTGQSLFNPEIHQELYYRG